MKIVKEHINEKFTEDSDPIRDLGIGLYSKRTFETQEEAVNFLIKIIPGILGTKEIPENIVTLYTKQHGEMTQKERKEMKIFNKIDDYIDKYIRVKELFMYSTSTSFVVSTLYRKLEQMGYKRYKSNKY